MPRRRGLQQRQESSSDSDSDSSGGPSRQRPVQEAGYRQLELAAALRHPADFAVAAAELAAILRQLYTARCSKAVQALLLDDVALAIGCCDTRLESRAALAALMEAAERHLPQAKRNALQRLYRKSSVQLRRQERRLGAGSTSAAAVASGGGTAEPEGSDQEEDDGEGQLPASFSHLPPEVIAHVFRHLDPVTLARSACVSREWRAAAAEDALWQRHCSYILSSRLPGPLRLLPAGPSGGNSINNSSRVATGGGDGSSKGASGSSNSFGSTDGGVCGEAKSGNNVRADAGPNCGNGGGSGAGSTTAYRQQFAAIARLNPSRLLPWRTNRVLIGARLAWRQAAAGVHATSSCRHVSTDTVLLYLKSGGSRRGGLGGGSSSSSDSSSGGDSGGEEGRLKQKLKFWHL